MIEIIKITHDGHRSNVELGCTCGQPSLESFECEDDRIIYCSNCGDITSRERLRNGATLIRPDMPWEFHGVSAQAECPLVNVSLPVEVHLDPTLTPQKPSVLPAVVTKISTEQCFLRFENSSDTHPWLQPSLLELNEIVLTSDLPPLQGETRAGLEEVLQPFGTQATTYYRLRFINPAHERKSQLEAFFQVSCGLDFDWRLLLCADLEPLRLLRRQFRSLLPNARIAAVTSPEDFQHSMEEHLPDLVIYPPTEAFHAIASRRGTGPQEKKVRQIALVGNRSSAAVAQALQLGVNDILFEDCAIDEVRRLIQSCKIEHDRHGSNRPRREDILSPYIWNNTAPAGNAAAVSVIDEEAVRLLCMASETHDVNRSNHLKRIAAYSAALTKRLGWDSARIACLATASKLHDIGKIGVADSILKKPGALTADERKLMELHTRFGYHILHTSSSEVIRLGGLIALRHHECYDGSGYPDRLQGNAIPLEGQVVSAVDVFDALTTQRVYKAAWSNEKAAAYLAEKAGRSFNPVVIDAYKHAMAELESIQQQFRDDFRDIWTERRDSTRWPVPPFTVHLEIAMPEQTFRPYRLEGQVSNLSEGGMKVLVTGVHHELFVMLTSTRRFGKVLFGVAEGNTPEQSLCGPDRKRPRKISPRRQIGLAKSVLNH